MIAHWVSTSNKSTYTRPTSDEGLEDSQWHAAQAALFGTSPWRNILLDECVSTCLEVQCKCNLILASSDLCPLEVALVMLVLGGSMLQHEAPRV